jgi:hypothetical protein
MHLVHPRPEPADSAGALEADQVIEPVDLGKALVAASTLVIIERVNDDVLCAAIRLIRGIHCRGGQTQSISPTENRAGADARLAKFTPSK